MKLMILNVNNLTDARYYAARGADYLAFKFPNAMDEAPAFLKKVESILEWVEGVKILLHCNESNYKLIETLEFPFNIEGYIVPNTAQLTKNIFGTEKKLIIEIVFNRCPTIETFNKTLAETKGNFPVLLTWESNVKAFDTLCSEILSSTDWKKTFDNADRDIFLQLPIAAENSLSLLKYFTFQGIILSASEETIVGEKNYDAEDDLLDALEVM